ncbi:MAG: PEP-CTERM sorting domain-containing protein [Phycisphaerae bacterium]
MEVIKSKGLLAGAMLAAVGFMGFNVGAVQATPTISVELIVSGSTAGSTVTSPIGSASGTKDFGSGSYDGYTWIDLNVQSLASGGGYTLELSLSGLQAGLGITSADHVTFSATSTAVGPGSNSLQSMASTFAVNLDSASSTESFSSAGGYVGAVGQSALSTGNLAFTPLSIVSPQSSSENNGTQDISSAGQTTSSQIQVDLNAFINPGTTVMSESTATWLSTSAVATPEPSAILLLAVAAMGALALVRRKPTTGS